jgi:hypothetical protein
MRGDGRPAGDVLKCTPPCRTIDVHPGMEGPAGGFVGPWGHGSTRAAAASSRVHLTGPAASTSTDWRAPQPACNLCTPGGSKLLLHDTTLQRCGGHESLLPSLHSRCSTPAAASMLTGSSTARLAVLLVHSRLQAVQCGLQLLAGSCQVATHQALLACGQVRGRRSAGSGKGLHVHWVGAWGLRRMRQLPRHNTVRVGGRWGGVGGHHPVNARPRPGACACSCARQSEATAPAPLPLLSCLSASPARYTTHACCQAGSLLPGWPPAPLAPPAPAPPLAPLASSSATSRSSGPVPSRSSSSCAEHG